MDLFRSEVVQIRSSNMCLSSALEPGMPWSQVLRKVFDEGDGGGEDPDAFPASATPRRAKGPPRVERDAPMTGRGGVIMERTNVMVRSLSTAMMELPLPGAAAAGEAILLVINLIVHVLEHGRSSRPACMHQ